MNVLTFDDPFDVIDLGKYLDDRQIELTRALYVAWHWDWFPPDALKWRFADVCALYFRVRHYGEVFGSEPERAAALTAIERAITEYMEDEYA